MLLKEHRQYVDERLRLSRISDAILHTKLGDEFNLRQEIEKGWNVNERDITTGRTPLIEAVAGGHFHIVRMLCNEFKVDVDKRTLLGDCTPLHVAVDMGFRQIASLLITHGASLNAVDKRGCTPLHLAKKMSLAKLLCKYDTNPCIRTREGLRPSEYYAKYCDSLEFDKEIELFLAEKETQRDMINAKTAKTTKMEIDPNAGNGALIVHASKALLENFRRLK